MSESLESNTPAAEAPRAELVIQAIADMARRRGLYASAVEIEQAWRVVAGADFEQKLDAAWRWLFPGHSIESLAPAALHNSHLPAWVREGERLFLLLERPNEAGQAKMMSADGRVHEALLTGTLLVPVPPQEAAQEGFVKAKPKGVATQAILAALQDHRGLFYRVGIVSLLMNLLSIVSSLFTMQVYDRVVPNFAYATLWVLASGVLLAYLFDLVFKLIRLRLLEASAQRLDEALSLYFFERLLNLKLDRRPARVGTLVAQVRDYEAVKSFFTSTTLFAIADLPFIVLFIAVVAMIGGPVALVLVVFVPISLAAGMAVYKPTARLQAEENDEAARRTGVLFEAVAGAEVVKAYGAEPRFSDIWLRAVRASASSGVRLRNLHSYAQFAAGLLQNLSYVAVIIVGVYVIESGKLTTGGLIACSILAGRVLGTTSQITKLLLQWHHARHALAVLDQVLANPADDDDARQAHTVAAPLELRAKALQYRYDAKSPPQLQIAELTIPAGQRLAVMGRNGSGKSTLLRLLAGIATPSAGEVLIAGLDMQQCRPSWLRETIGYLPQEVRLVSGTLAENLTLGMTHPGEERILQAMEKTGLMQTLGRHPLGLALPIREGGSGLSGGQRQMVGLTRLVLQNPRIWLLDEPSASLDADSEARLVTLLRELPRDRSVVFTSHRQAWLSIADRMILMEDGAIKADAPAEQVRSLQRQALKQTAGTAKTGNG